MDMGVTRGRNTRSSQGGSRNDEFAGNRNSGRNRSQSSRATKRSSSI
jgi:hypothetical protein